MNRLKLVAVIYLVKTLIIGAACLVVPDLPERTMTWARQTWASWSHSEPAPDASRPTVR